MSETRLNHWYENFWVGIGVMVFLICAGLALYEVAKAMT